MIQRKKMILTVLVSALFSILSATAAHAQDGTGGSASSGGLFVEPGIYYQSTDTKTKYPAPFSDATGKITGPGIYGRLGMHVADIFILGGEARYYMGGFKDSSLDINTTATGLNYGAFGAVQTPFYGIRVIGTAILGGDLNPEADRNVDVKLGKAEGYRVGVGMHFASLSVTAEYQDMSYKSATLEQIGGFNAGTNFDNVSYTDKGLLVSVGFPIAL